MLTQESIVRVLREHRRFLAIEYGVRRIGLFGSHAQGTATQDSDVDLVVEFGRPIGFRFAEFVEYLEALLERPVDVLTPAGVRAIRIEAVAKSIEDSTIYV